MALGSFIGFGLVFVLITWSSSIVAGLALSLSAKRLREQGSAGEKRAAAVALVLPPLLGLLVAGSLALYSLYPAWIGGADHCTTHGNHLHLCLTHGGEWASRAWALSLVAGLSALVLVRFAQLLEARLSGRKQVLAVERSSMRIEEGKVPVFRSPSNKAFCFVTGVRDPRIFVASDLWDRSSEGERRAMLAHEHSHIANGDLWRSSVLSCFALVGAPVLAAHYKRLWGAAAERLCDRMAADETGDAATVAAALVNMLRTPHLRLAMSFSPLAGSVEERVVAVLSQERRGLAFASNLVKASGLLLVAVAATTLLLADPFHHALESFFSLI